MKKLSPNKLFITTAVVVMIISLVLMLMGVYYGFKLATVIGFIAFTGTALTIDFNQHINNLNK